MLQAYEISHEFICFLVILCLFVFVRYILPKTIEKLIKNMKVLSRRLKPIKSIVYDCLGFFIL